MNFFSLWQLNKGIMYPQLCVRHAFFAYNMLDFFRLQMSLFQCLCHSLNWDEADMLLGQSQCFSKERKSIDSSFDLVQGQNTLHL